MIWIIAARETLDNLMSLKFLFGTMLCLVLVVISIVISLRDYQNRMDEYNAAMTEFNEKPNVSQPRVYRKPEVLSIFVQGFERRFGNAVTLDSRVPVQAGGYMGTMESAQFSAEFASIDFLFVVRVILSLLAIFLSYDVISGEYERGTLRLVLSRPVPRSSVILGKLMAGTVCLLIPLVMSFIIGILIVQLVIGMGFTTEDWLRIAFIAGIAVLCVMSFYMLGLVVSSRTRQAATSLLILLLIWVTAIFLIPGIATAIVERHRLTGPSPERNIATIRENFDKRLREEPRPDYYKDREAYIRWATKWDELTDEKNHAIWSLQRQYLNKLYFQADWVRGILRISPSGSCAYAAAAMARTDVGAYRSFMRYVRSYHEQHREFRKNRFKDRDEYAKQRKKYVGATLAPSADFAESFRVAVLDICLLILFNALFFMLSTLFFIRYDVH